MKICFVSFVSFLCCFHLSFALYAIYHSNVEQDYMRMRRDYSGPNHEPLEFSNELRRIQLCDKVLRANKYLYPYELVDFESNLRMLEVKESKINRYNAQLLSYNQGSNASKYQYKIKQILVDSSAIMNMRIFLCAEVKDTQWYVTYGYRTGHVFLLTKFKTADDSTLKLHSMLAPTPKLNTELSFIAVDNGRVLDNYFWQFFRGEHTSSRTNNFYQVLKFMEMCWLTEDEHRYFEVCSSVANALNKHKSYHQAMELDIEKSNFVRKIPNSKGCVTGPLLDSRNGAIVNVRVLPCAVNSHWSNPQFYLLRDPNFSFQTSLFVLKEQDGVLMLIAYVDNVSALTNLRHSVRSIIL